MATHPITDNKHRVISDAMTPSDCQGHLMSWSSDSNSQLCKCLLNAGKSCTTPRLHWLQCDLREWYLTWIMWAASYIANVAQGCQEAGCQQSVYTDNIGQGAGCQHSIFLSLQNFQVTKKWKADEMHIHSNCIWQCCNLWPMSRLQTISDSK